jgi:mannose-6-phosphate isomerase-like protein (cupin superfamily)
MSDDIGIRALGGAPMRRPNWTVLASGAATRGTFELFSETRPSLGGPPRHVHRDREEGFFVLTGRYAFVRGTEELEVGPGQFVLVPRGTRHHFRTLVEPSETLILIAPAGLEGFFNGMGERMAAGATALEAMTELSRTFDSTPA